MSKENGFEENIDDAISFLYDREGRRKYLVVDERRQFIQVAQNLKDPLARTFCLTLAYTGARISEILALTARQLDFEIQTVVINSMKKRRRFSYRAVPRRISRTTRSLRHPL